jgi:hypothetical protein
LNSELAACLSASFPRKRYEKIGIAPFLSWPGLTRPSRSLIYHDLLDGRLKGGHDKEGEANLL